MECDKCGREAVMHAAYSGLHMCAEHFCRSVESRVRRRIREDALLSDEATPEEAAETGVLVTGGDGRLTAVVEKPGDPPSRLVLTGLSAFDPDVFHACHLVQLSDRGEYELADAIDLLVRAGRRVETVPFGGWRVNVNTPADRQRAQIRFQ